MQDEQLPDRPVTWNTVKRLFNGIDIAYMHMIGWPLDDYKFVKKNAGTILGRIKHEENPMPPKPFRPWSTEMVTVFENWIADDFQEKAENIPERLQKFIGLSEFLTGFDDLHQDPELAQKYINQLDDNEADSKEAEKGSIGFLTPCIITRAQLDGLIEAFAATGQIPGESKKTAQTVCLIWYCAEIINNQVGDDLYGFPIKARIVNAENNQWRRGLAWRAAEAHPMGYATDGYFDGDSGEFTSFRKDDGKPYWHFEPKNGKYTGLANPPQLS